MNQETGCLILDDDELEKGPSRTWITDKKSLETSRVFGGFTKKHFPPAFRNTKREPLDIKGHGALFKSVKAMLNPEKPLDTWNKTD